MAARGEYDNGVDDYRCTQTRFWSASCRFEIVRVTGTRGGIGGAAARPRQGQGFRTRRRSTRCGASSTSCRSTARVVIGEGEMDEAPMLFIGETGRHQEQAFKVDIAVDPLEGTTLCAKNMPGAIATMAMADGRYAVARAGLLHGQDRDRPRLSEAGTIDLDAPADENITESLPRPRRVKPSEITAILLDRPRHADAIAPRFARPVRRSPVDQRRRRRGRHPLRRAEDRHRHLSRHRRRAGGRAGGGGVALHRRPDAVPSGDRHRSAARTHARRWASRTRRRTTRSRTW